MLPLPDAKMFMPCVRCSVAAWCRLLRDQAPHRGGREAALVCQINFTLRGMDDPHPENHSRYHFRGHGEWRWQRCVSGRAPDRRTVHWRGAVSPQRRGIAQSIGCVAAEHRSGCGQLPSSGVHQ